jgi:predicted metal-dependent HD superfamily phosphohydrolase
MRRKWSTFSRQGCRLAAGCEASEWVRVSAFTNNPNMHDIADRSHQLQQKLAIAWQQYWQDLPIDSSTVDRIFQLLINAYCQPDRYYHNLTHIDRVICTIARFSATLTDPLAVYLAAWFHDFIYDPRANDNELQSARAAAELLTDIGMEPDKIDRISELILATQGHQIDPNDPDRCIFLDADLAILGADPAEYAIYQRSIRSEYSWVADDAYRTGRMRVLTSFLQRDRLYHTDLLFNELESIARTNITTEIIQLNAKDRT